ncbi:MAG TPA: HypC/HybG/HupF family hydrogenase formation chaperone [Accumulibacter sp.]|uniref:HypC/HybG/HupF family hydrogenase formation chaperone n=1 Tax=Accumulibacter sp. TaxID=2053492 RepID=UPI002608A9CD|nr:HypC/HybG/HupF family hydrogenase formation chaperone [Accumulibacter sp.]MDS4054116.1 HypC/HybG/HupF family hydrogenase formation chaperone [Accumulibacter sp.]HMV05087.1 HypC/HybG/HupF family hydrogenase formation chaperone [Accumulibacter sp.]HMW63289.1 HypC/HybG/HupF family hydrogenase formation chaperone [Accumulibacter sp.]HMW79805.1 HypC/HybG/HupF family hydrogenase formation chaperone [Accumulibacter sp.]HMX69558.1 HypC/HybG/HupF family hydrogenase formation chaperone [Accumulibacte
MCLSLPMQVVAQADDNGHFAIVERHEHGTLRRERANMMLIGPQAVGTWVLVALGLAREVVADGERALIEDALAALAAELAGDYDPALHFTDLTSRDPARRRET